ncbi:hypothetical protein QTN25_003462 [Entamoeba marina]
MHSVDYDFSKDLLNNIDDILKFEQQNLDHCLMFSETINNISLQHSDRVEKLHKILNDESYLSKESPVYVFQESLYYILKQVADGSDSLSFTINSKINNQILSRIDCFKNKLREIQTLHENNELFITKVHHDYATTYQCYHNFQKNKTFKGNQKLFSDYLYGEMQAAKTVYDSEYPYYSQTKNRVLAELQQFIHDKVNFFNLVTNQLIDILTKSYDIISKIIHSQEHIYYNGFDEEAKLVKKFSDQPEIPIFFRLDLKKQRQQLFGISIQELVSSQELTTPLDIPLILLIIVDTLRSLKDYTDPTLFQTPGNATLASCYRILFEQGDFVFKKDVSLHVLASILLYFLVNIPDHLIPIDKHKAAHTANIANLQKAKEDPDYLEYSQALMGRENVEENTLWLENVIDACPPGLSDNFKLRCDKYPNRVGLEMVDSDPLDLIFPTSFKKVIVKPLNPHEYKMSLITQSLADIKDKRVSSLNVFDVDDENESDSTKDVESNISPLDKDINALLKGLEEEDKNDIDWEESNDYEDEPFFCISKI